MPISLSPPGLLVVTALPAGVVAGSDPAMARLQVLIMPQLAMGGTDPTISDFTAAFGGSLSAALFGAGGAGAVTFDTAISGQSLPALVPQPLTVPYDPALWDAVIPAATLLGPPPDASVLANPAITSYSVSGNYTAVQGGLQPVPGQTQRPRAIDTLAAQLQAQRPALNAHLQSLRRRHPTLTRAHMAAEPGPFSPELLAFADMDDYYGQLAAGAQARAATGGTTVQRPLDFHSAMTALIRYPDLLRALGLLYEVQIPVSDLSGSGQIMVAPTAGTIGPGWQVATPWTLFDASAGFITAPANPAILSDILRGVLALPPDVVQPVAFDFDAAVHNLGGRLLQARPAATTSAAVPVLTLAASRSNGLGLAKDALGTDMASILMAQAALDTALTNDPGGGSVVLGIEQLSRGLKIDIMSDKDPTWRTLSARSCSYSVPGWSGSIPATPDEGVQPWRIFNPTAVPSALWTHEALFQWSGWGLSVPRPGMATAQDGSVFDPNAPGTGLGGNLPVQVVVTPVPGSLPRLRFGWAYDCRLRIADLAGYSVAVDDPAIATTGVIGLGTYLRWDPVIAPVLVPKAAPGPGETVEQLVIRCTDVTAPTTDVAERLVAPPRATVQMAEWHGMFDVAAGVDPNAYTVITSQDGAFSATPYGDTPPSLPYLPDPLGRGVCFNVSAPNAGTASHQQLQLQVPFGGTWPQIVPLPLQLVEGAQPALAASGGIITMSLPKGETASYLLSSSVKVNPADPDDTDIAILALCHAPKSREVWWRQEVIDGQMPQIVPQRSISFVHAVQRPVLVPSITDQFGQATAMGCFYSYTDGRTVAEFAPYAAIHPGSTARLEIMAEWDETVDDGINAPFVRHVSKRAWGTDVAVNDPRFFSTEDNYGNPVQTSQFALNWPLTDFRDVRYRRITCTLVATTRFREYFPAAIAADPANLTQVSAPYTMDVSTPVTPPTPKVIGVVPLFDWSTSALDQGNQRSLSTGVRVYLDRPWYATGDNEVLGVVIPIATPPMQPPPPDPSPRPIPHPPPPGPGPHPNPVVRQPLDAIESAPSIADADVPLLTQWGTDPAFSSLAPPATPAPLPAQFLNALYVLPDNDMYYPEARSATCALLGFAVTFQPPDPANPSAPANPQRDPHNGRWYCDILLNAAACAVPFLRLALVRFQPNGTDPTLPTARPLASRTVLADFVQLSAQRTASVVADSTGAQAVDVAVSGPISVVNNTSDTTTRPLHRMAATAQADIGTAGQPVWASFAQLDLTPDTSEAPVQMVWSGSVPLPAARGSASLRIMVQEWEPLPTDAGLQERLIYSDFVPV